MSLHCDLVYLADTAGLITSFVNLALVPEAVSNWLLPARIGHVRAYAMFALGESVDAVTALSWGLANALVPVGDLRTPGTKCGGGADEATRPLAAANQSIDAGLRQISRQIDREGKIFGERLVSAEAQEGFTAFAERRKPDFSKVQG